MMKASVVWMNNRLLNADDVKISPFDLGLTVGLGVFETMVAYEGKVFAWDKHYQRFQNSAQKLGLKVLDKSVLKDAMSEVISANDLHTGRARVRLSISGGENPLAGGESQGNVIITATSQPEPAEYAKLIVSSQLCPDTGALVGVKTASYAANVMAYREAISQGADEALMFTHDGILSEGSMSNVFFVKNGVVKTPSLSSGCLPGVTRALVIELCQKLNILIEECDLKKLDLFSADEIFITSSAREVQAACMLSEEFFEIGKITKRLKDSYCSLC